MSSATSPKEDTARRADREREVTLDVAIPAFSARAPAERA
jgi:hypothetical protein